MERNGERTGNNKRKDRGSEWANNGDMSWTKGDGQSNPTHLRSKGKKKGRKEGSEDQK